MTKQKKIGSVFLLLAGLTAGLSTEYLRTQPTEIVTGHGSVTALQSKYQSWKAGYESNQGAEVLSLRMGFAKAFSRNPTGASGLAKINLLDGTIEVKLQGLETGEHYAFWLTGKQDNASTPAVEKQISSFQAESNQHLLTAKLDRQALQGFHINKVSITLANQTPAKDELLTGSPSLFQRMYYNDLLWTVAGVGQLAQAPQAEIPFGFLLPKPAHADALHTNLEAVLGQQIALGRDLFVNETFGGNGRTCETCHRLDNNHTIDPNYIANLPDNDPLFIAEQNPDLAELENPKLLRQFGLILENIDGFDRPGVFRGVPHVLAMMTSVTAEDFESGVAKEGHLVESAVGWSADGAPGDGSLRSFTVGAVTQHMPLTLNRVAGEDFRLPTDEELDAMEAYQLSLGRQFDPDLDFMFFSSPVVQQGRELFHSKDQGTGMCKGCHLNGGGNSSSSGQNGNRNTGVENAPSLAKLVWEPTPIDGGFGKDEANDCGPNGDETCFGNKEFNMTTVIESVDTAPFFHNNSVNTIEGAIAFYTTPAFHESPGAKPAGSLNSDGEPRAECERCITLEPTQITAIALFLRTLNAMENIRSSNELLAQASQLNINNGRKILKLARAETRDAIQVLRGGEIITNPESLALLRAALDLEKKAANKSKKSKRNQLIEQATELKLEANTLFLRDEEDVPA